MERRLIIALSTALAVALLAIAFLLGRRSERASLVGAASPSVVTAPAAPAASAGSAGSAGSAEVALPAPDASTGATTAVGEPRSSTPMDNARTAALSTAPARPAPALGSVAVAGDDALVRPEVLRYFAQVDAIQAEAKTATGDPEAMAQLILKHATDGDMTEFDTLLRTQRGLADRLRAVVPPPPCADHLRKSVAAVDDGIAILEKTRNALAASDFTSLAALTTVGQELESRAREVDALGAALKKRFAL